MHVPYTEFILRILSGNSQVHPYRLLPVTPIERNLIFDSCLARRRCLLTFLLVPNSKHVGHGVTFSRDSTKNVPFHKCQQINIVVKRKKSYKGQLISKANYGLLTSPKNERTNLFCLFFYSSRQTNQIRLFVFGII